MDGKPRRVRRLKRGAIVIVMEPGIAFKLLDRGAELEFYCRDGSVPFFEPTQLPEGEIAIQLTKRRASA